MNLRKLILTDNACYQAGMTMMPKGIMLHSTSANNPYLKRYLGPDDGLLGENQHNNHWNQPTPDGEKKCVHAFIGKLADGSIATYQTLPWNHRGWHCGSLGNDTHIAFEICEDGLTDAGYFDAVYREATELCAHLCKEYGLNETQIVCHSEGCKQGIATNHADVMHWFPRHGKNMDSLRAEVRRLLTMDIPSPMVDVANFNVGCSESTANLQKGSMGDDVCWVQNQLNLYGANLVVDGDFDPATDAAVREFQRNNDLVEDGVVGSLTRAKLKGQ
ncbi:MAG: N-acetylmuramoyl-L-alanine amidase [Betaproteobacteria bacterium]|nr:N-acetylmuramoyl-L-alanine amidase [Betaproteobacteria bacterium]